MDIIFQRTTGRLQKIVLSLAGILLICMVPLLLSVLWLIWDHHIFFLRWWWWWLHSRCDLSGRKSLNKICTSPQRITETWGKTFPLMFKLWAAVSFKMTHVLCYSKRGGIDTWKLLLKIMQKVLAIFFQKEDISLRTTLVSINVIFKVILRFWNYCVVWDWSVGTLASCWYLMFWALSRVEKSVLEFFLSVSCHYFLGIVSGFGLPACLQDVRIASFLLITCNK